jgi:hypothetical protein
MLCGMAAFKQHCSFGFWRAKELAEQHKELDADKKPGMGQFGNLKSVSDLPPKKF